MTRYAAAWHPQSDNLGDDLLTLAASRLLPRVDMTLDADRLDAPLPHLTEQDRVVTLLCGKVLAQPIHWPPERHIAPVMVGAHFSREDVWGVPLRDLSGAGLAYLQAMAPVGCRDQVSMTLLEDMQLPCTLTACLTLTLEKPPVTQPEKPCIVCCDVPEDVLHAVENAVPTMDVQSVTHQMKDAPQDYRQRMDAARAMLERYAAATCVITRRLHCAMACLAIGTPVLLLYHADYEDVNRFTPMSDMMRVQPMDRFLAEIRAGKFQPAWENPPQVRQWQELLRQRVAEGLQQAETMPLPIVPPAQAQAWQEDCLRTTAHSAARKIQRLEKERYEGLHEKFSLILREDTAKGTLTTLLHEPEVVRALHRAERRRCLALEKWYKRPWQWLMLRLGRVETENLARLAEDVLTPLGWPDEHKGAAD
ncbi:MAG: polysaccharide pyruvyl transferase family protein [Aristaeellaceae bacterium]